MFGVAKIGDKLSGEEKFTKSIGCSKTESLLRLYL